MIVSNINIVKQDDSIKKNLKKFITSRHKVEKYLISWNNLWVNYDPSLIQKKNGEYGSFRQKWIFDSKPKIVIKLFGKSIQAALDCKGYYANNSLILLLIKAYQQKTIELLRFSFSSLEDEFYYLLAILNSELIAQYYRILYSHTHVRGNYLQFYIKDLENIPIIIPSSKNHELVAKIILIVKEIEKNCHEHNNSAQKKNEKILNAEIRKLYGL